MLAIGPALHQLARAHRHDACRAGWLCLCDYRGYRTLPYSPRNLPPVSRWLARFYRPCTGFNGAGLGRAPAGNLARQAHAVALLLALVGIGLHGFTDGLALGQGGHEHAGEHMLPWAVVLHRLPVGLWCGSSSGPFMDYGSRWQRFC